MTSDYSYPESKIIDGIIFRESARGAHRAYLHASTMADNNALHDAVEKLVAKGWQCIPYTFDDKPMLEVRGFARDSQLVSLLSELKLTSGQVSISENEKAAPGFIDRLKKRSLQASGVFYGVGDAYFIGYGHKGESKLNTAAGIFYALPTPVLLAYGKNDQSSLQIEDLSRQMSKYLTNEGIKLPNECSLQSIVDDHKKGLIKTTNDLFQRYPSEFMNLSFAVAGACIAAAAVPYLGKGVVKDKRLENWLNVGVGASTISSGLFAAMVNEKKHDPDAPKKHGLAAVWEWAQEKPLAVAGIGYIVSTFLHAASAKVGMRSKDPAHREAVKMRWVFVGASLIAELLVAISSKGHGQGVVSDNSVDNSVIALSADLISKQPPAMQESLIEHVATFLGRPDVMAVKDANIREKLHTQVEAMRNNPWAHAVDASPKTAAVPVWQAKIDTAPTPGQNALA